MHKCPHCQQELSSFAFRCIRCSKEVGRVEREGDMLAVWWLDGSGSLIERIRVKTLVSGEISVDARELTYVSNEGGSPYVLITLANEDVPRKQDLVEFFLQATKTTQEWKL